MHLLRFRQANLVGDAKSSASKAGLVRRWVPTATAPAKIASYEQSLKDLGVVIEELGEQGDA